MVNRGYSCELSRTAIYKQSIKKNEHERFYNNQHTKKIEVEIKIKTKYTNDLLSIIIL